MKDDELDHILTEYDPEDIRVMSSHDGFRIYEKTGETDEFGHRDEPKLWSWDPSWDGEPFQAIETLFNHLGHDVEVM